MVDNDGTKHGRMKAREQELLLGYLLNALDEHEAAQVERELPRNPHLRAELARLQREIAPLDYISDSVEPPPGLASRTCAKIWATLDGEEQADASNSGTFLDSAFFSPESMLHSPFLTYDEPEEVKPVPKRAVRTLETNDEEDDDDDDEPPHSSRIGLIASVSVGIVIACFLFPMIRYAERSTRSYVTDSWMSEINRRVGQYEQIYGAQTSISMGGEEIVPYNLALSGWQELRLEDLRLASENFTSDCVSAVKQDGRVLFPPLPVEWLIYSAEEPVSHVTEDHILLIIPGWENPLRTAFGRALHFHDGRVFSRVLPGAE